MPSLSIIINKLGDLVTLELVGHDFEYEISEIIDLFIDKNSRLKYKIVSSLEVNGHIKNTMEEIQKLNSESVTVHTLAIKRASKLKECLNDYDLSKTDTIQKMIEISREYIKNMGLSAYYMYRQKNMLGNFGNIGYAKVGFKCIYNIQIMEEKQTIIALGAGATSKIIYDDNRIEKIFNGKNVEEYIKRIDEMIERKKILNNLN